MSKINLDEYIARQIAARPVEATLVRKIVRALKAAGTPVVKGYDGEEFEKLTTEKSVLDFAFNLDEFRLYTADGAWVFVVMGQGAEGLTDYSLDLEDALEPLSDWIDKNMD